MFSGKAKNRKKRSNPISSEADAFGDAKGANLDGFHWTYKKGEKQKKQLDPKTIKVENSLRHKDFSPSPVLESRLGAVAAQRFCKHLSDPIQTPTPPEVTESKKHPGHSSGHKGGQSLSSEDVSANLTPEGASLTSEGASLSKEAAQLIMKIIQADLSGSLSANVRATLFALLNIKAGE